MKTTLPNASFWQNKRVLITGHTGFKGSWLSLWLNRLGAHVSGIGLPPITTPNLFEVAHISEITDSYFCDILDIDKLQEVAQKSRPEIVFHMAAQPLVRQSYIEPVNTFSTNLMGTVNVLEVLRVLDCLKSAVMVTTDKVYLNTNWYWPFRENDMLGGHDPYSASKAASEIVISSYRASFLKRQDLGLASARAGNVIGGGDWSADRLFPDAIRAWQNGKTLKIRKPKSTRPWQHVLEPLAGYLVLAEKIWETPNLSDAYNFGPRLNAAATVKEVIGLASATYENCKVEYVADDTNLVEADRLVLDISKAQQLLGYEPRLSLKEAINMTISWYQSQNAGIDPRKLCENDIAVFEEKN
jgi:CDP-glucose 4,6-dehydratase